MATLKTHGLCGHLSFVTRLQASDTALEALPTQAPSGATAPKLGKGHKVPCRPLKLRSHHGAPSSHAWSSSKASRLHFAGPLGLSSILCPFSGPPETPGGCTRSRRQGGVHALCFLLSESLLAPSSLRGILGSQRPRESLCLLLLQTGGGCLWQVLLQLQAQVVKADAGDWRDAALQWLSRACWGGTV